MATSNENQVIRELCNITECCICLKTYSDPRMLPCIHTFCLGCLQEIGSKLVRTAPQELPCPICRKEFVIPANGLEVLPKNFFMEKLIGMTEATRMRSAKRKSYCDICAENHDDEGKEMKYAIEYCIDCHDRLCTDCVREHKKHRPSKDHQLVEVGSHTEETATSKKILKCSQHQDKSLEVYCIDCKQLVCVLCLVTSHQGHSGEDVNCFMREFSKDVEKDVGKLEALEKLGLALMEHLVEKKEKFLQESNDVDFAILQQGQKLKDVIDRHVKSLHDELYLLRENHLKELEGQREELEKKISTIISFKDYYNEMRMKTSPDEICQVKGEMHCETKELIKGLCEQKLSSNSISFKEGVHLEKLFQAQEELLSSGTSGSPKHNIVGNITVETDMATQLEQSLVIVGLDDGSNITRDVCRISLSRPNEFTRLPQIPCRMAIEASAITFNNALFVIGVGTSKTEIWRYDFPAGWTKCGNLNQGRRRHSTASVDRFLYICGGFVDSEKTVIDSVESFDAAGDAKLCRAVGKLIFCVQGAACVAYRRCVYLFGGADNDSRALDCVQSYDTVLDSCTLLSKPMPRAYKLMRVVVWNTSAILLGNLACFVFDFEKETWHEREQFKMDVGHFALFLCDDRLFVVGGGELKSGQDGKAIWTCKDEIRVVSVTSVIEDKRIGWLKFGSVPKPTMIHSYGLVTSFDK